MARAFARVLGAGLSSPAVQSLQQGLRLTVRVSEVSGKPGSADMLACCLSAGLHRRWRSALHTSCLYRPCTSEHAL